jgi:hypothetical protein
MASQQQAIAPSPAAAAATVTTSTDRTDALHHCGKIQRQIVAAGWKHSHSTGDNTQLLMSTHIQTKAAQIRCQPPESSNTFGRTVLVQLQAATAAAASTGLCSTPSNQALTPRLNTTASPHTTTTQHTAPLALLDRLLNMVGCCLKWRPDNSQQQEKHPQQLYHAPLAGMTESWVTSRARPLP